MDISLVMFKANGDRRDFKVRGRAIIGRKHSCDLRIPLPNVSRQHCEIVVEGQTAKVHDLGSSNGTYHNSKRIDQAVLSAGDEVVVGPVIFTIIIDGQPQDILPVRTVVKTTGNSSSNSDSSIADFFDGSDELGDTEQSKKPLKVDSDDPAGAHDTIVG